MFATHWTTTSRFRLAATLAVAAPLLMAGSTFAAATFSDDFNDGNLADQWTTTQVDGSTISIVNQQLQMADSGSYAAGSKIASNDAFTFPTGVQFTFQLIGSNTPYERVSFSLPGHALLVYTHSTATNKSGETYEDEYVGLFIDQENDGIDRDSIGQLNTSSSGDRVWWSNVWAKTHLVPANHYLGFRMDKDGWAIITSADGEHYSLLYGGPDGNGPSTGVFATPMDMNFTTHPTIFIENANGSPTLTIDNLSVVPEPGSLALLGLGGLMLLRRKRRRR